MNHATKPVWKRWLAQLLLWPGAAGAGLAAGSTLWAQDALPPVPDAPVAADMRPAESDPKSDQARMLMIKAKEAYSLSDYTRARELALRAAALRGRYEPGEDTPEVMLRRISERTGLPAAMPVAASAKQPDLPSMKTPAPRAAEVSRPTRTATSSADTSGMTPAQLLKAGRDAFETGKLDMAQDLGRQAEKLKPSRSWGFFDDTPSSLLADVQKAKLKRDRAESEQLLKDARVLAAKPAASEDEKLANLESAQGMASQAERLHGSYSIWDLGDKPSKLIAEIETSRVKLKNALAKKGRTPSSAEPAKVVGGMPVKSAQPAPLDPPPVMGDDAKKQAVALMAEADALTKKGMYPEAKAKLVAAQRLRAPFATDEATPEQASQTLHREALGKIASLCNAASELSLKGDFAKADDKLDEAQGLANRLGLDAAAVTEHRTAVASRKGKSAPKVVEAPAIALAPVPMAEPKGSPPVAVVPPVPVPDVKPVAVTPMKGSRGQELLSQARAELRRGETESARKMAHEAASGQGVDEEAQALLRTISFEETEQARRTAVKTYESGVQSYQEGRYRQALAVFQLIDPMTLPAEKRPSLKEMTIQASAKVRATEGGDLLAAQGTETPGMVKPANQPDSLMRQQEALQEVQFQKLRQEGLRVQKEATEKFGRGETDEALDSLRAFVVKVKAAGFDPARAALLTRAVESRIASLDLLKHQKDVLTGQERSHEKFRTDMEAKEAAGRKREDDLAKGLKEFQALMQAHKYQEAGRVADQLRELNPDNPVVVAAASMSRTAYRQKVWDGIKDGKEKWNWEAGNDANDLGPAATTKNPLIFDKDRTLELQALRPTMRGGLGSPRMRTEREHQIEQKLRGSTIDLNFRQTPLADVISDIQVKSGINITVAPNVAEENVNLKLPITEKLTDLPLQDALKIVLRHAKLTYLVEDNVLKITTAKGAQGKLKLVNYAVSDLVIPIENVETPRTSSLTAMLENHIETNKLVSNATQAFTPTLGVSAASGAGVGSSTTGAGRMSANLPGDVTVQVGTGRGTRHQVLIDTIKNMIAPDTWDSAGGSGRIEYNPLAFALTVSQTPDVLEQVEQLLDQLRQLQDVEVSIEVRLISLAETFYERIGVDFAMNVRTNSTNNEPNIASGNFRPSPFINDNNTRGQVIGLTPAGIGSFTSDLDVPIRATSFNYAIPPFGGFLNNPASNGGLSVGLAFLNDIQVQLFLEAAQGDRRTNIMQAPKLTMFNGQSASISLQDQQFFVTGVQVLAIGGQVVFSPTSQPFPLGLQLTLQPAVSGDRRFVRINVNFSVTSLPSGDATVPLFPVTTAVQTFFDGNFPGPTVPLTQYIQLPTFKTITVNTTVAVPDGGTVILGGLKTLSEGRNEFGPPVLSKVPYLNRLFKNVGYGREASSQLLMITPRIILNREEEFKQTGVINGNIGAPTDETPGNP